MASVTDDERRRVAKRLRGLNGNVSYVRCVYEAEGLSILCDDQADYYQICHSVAGYLPAEHMHPCDYEELHARLADLIEPEEVTGDTSDGYHTFDELYDHRAKLFSVVVRDHRELAWKSRLHHDGTMYEGMFIVGVETPGGQATYHYDLDPYWGIFDCEELDRAPEWDGHTPQQAIDRIAALGPSCDRDALLALAAGLEADADRIIKAAKNARFGGGPRMSEAKLDAEEWRSIARRIREACGVVA